MPGPDLAQELLATAQSDLRALEHMLDLGDYAVRFRYEALIEGEEPLDRERLLGDVQGLMRHVTGLVKGRRAR